MARTPEEIEEIKARIKRAEDAYETLMLGGAAVEFTDQNGERIRYSGARKSDLLAYINYLRGLLDMEPFGYGRAVRPAGVIF